MAAKLNIESLKLLFEGSEKKLATQEEPVLIMDCIAMVNEHGKLCCQRFGCDTSLPPVEGESKWPTDYEYENLRTYKYWKVFIGRTGTKWDSHVTWLPIQYELET